MANNLVLITQHGLNQINEAHSDGSLIDIQYYLPVYDYRIDPNAHVVGGPFSPTDITTVASSADVIPTGEIFWNPGSDAYAYVQSSPNDCYIVSGDGTYTVGTSIVNALQKAHTAVTLYGEVTGAKYPTASYIKSDSESSYYDDPINQWKTSTFWDSLPTSAVSVDINKPLQQYLYPGVVYSSVISSGSNKRANFRVTVTSPYGTIKFNKIGLYGVKRIGSDVYGTQPFLFAEVIIPVPQIVSTNSLTNGQAGELVLDFQVESKAASGSFDNLIYSSEHDYWQRVSNENGSYGLAYDGNVYISNRLAIDDKNVWVGTSADTGVSKLFVSTFETINNNTPTEELNKPQMCLQMVTNGTKTSTSKRIRTTFRTNQQGHCEVDFYGACTSGTPVYSIIPKIDDTFGLGVNNRKTTARWREIRLSRLMSVYGGSPVDGGDDFYFESSTYENKSSTNMEIVVDDYYIDTTPYDKFFRGNIMAREQEKLFIRTSVELEGVTDTDMWLLAGNWSKKDGTIAEYGNNAFIVSSLMDYYVNARGVDTGGWWRTEAENYHGSLYMSGNGYIHAMASIFFMEDPMPFGDGIISMGLESADNGKTTTPLAFSNMVTHKISNAGRDVGLYSSLIPTASTFNNEKKLYPSLGSASNYFNYLYVNTIKTNSICLGGGACWNDKEIDFNKGTIRVNKLYANWANITTLIVDDFTATTAHIKNLSFDNVIQNAYKYTGGLIDWSGGGDFVHSWPVTIESLTVNPLTNAGFFKFSIPTRGNFAKTSWSDDKTYDDWTDRKDISFILSMCFKSYSRMSVIGNSKQTGRVRASVHEDGPFHFDATWQEFDAEYYINLSPDNTSGSIYGAIHFGGYNIHKNNSIDFKSTNDEKIIFTMKIEDVVIDATKWSV